MPSLRICSRTSNATPKDLAIRNKSILLSAPLVFLPTVSNISSSKSQAQATYIIDLPQMVAINLITNT